MSVASAESRTCHFEPQSLSMPPIASIKEVEDLSSWSRSQIVSVVIRADLVSYNVLVGGGPSGKTSSKDALYSARGIGQVQNWEESPTDEMKGAGCPSSIRRPVCWGDGGCGLGDAPSVGLGALEVLAPPLASVSCLSTSFLGSCCCQEKSGASSCWRPNRSRVWSSGGSRLANRMHAVNPGLSSCIWPGV